MADPLPSFPRNRIVYEDPWLLAVDKPVGISSEAGRFDDATSRARALLCSEKEQLFTVQRLERGASGVLLFSRQRSANGMLAKQLERAETDAAWIIAVPSWTLGERGRIAGIPYEVVAAHRERVLLELAPAPLRLSLLKQRLSSFFTEQTPAPHLRSIAIDHPGRRVTLTVSAHLPERLTGWLYGNRWAGLRDSIERRFGILHDGTTNAVRLANDAGDETPGITVDLYGDHWLVQCYDPLEEAERNALFDALAGFGPKGLYAKFRPKQSNTLGDTRREELAPAKAVRGENAPDEFVLRENGLRYCVRLGDGLSTGIFLDQRANRQWLRTQSRDRSVLNLFAYTGPFTVAAASGGARRTMSVDLSRSALAWARKNLAENALENDAHTFAVAEVFGWLDGAKARRERYDLIVLDPPSHSTAKDGPRFTADGGYRKLAATALSVLESGGTLLACTNHRGIPHARFRRYLHEAARDAKREVLAVKDLPAPEDFPPLPGEEPHLKSVLVQVR